MRDTPWGKENEINLLQPLNTNTVTQDTFGFEKGGPALLNNGLNRDGGITELFETSATLAGANYFFVTSNGFVLGLNSDGTVYTTSGSSATTPDLYPSPTLYPSDTLYPSGGLTDVYQLGKLNSFNFFKRVAVPTMYIDVKVTSDYKLVGIRYGSTTSLIIDEFDPVTMIVSDSYTATTATMTTMPAVEIAACNTLTFTTVRDKGGFIYNVGTAVYYCVPGKAINANTAWTTDTVGQSFSAYYVDGTTPASHATIVFSSTYQGSSRIYSSPAIDTASLSWTRQRLGGTVDGIMMADFGTNILSATKTGATDALILGVSTASLIAPNFVLTVSSVGVVATSTAYTGGTIVLYSSVGANAANFTMICGVVTPYGSSGIYKDTGGNYGTFHTSLCLDSAGTTTVPTGLMYMAYPQLDVVHQMLSIRSSMGVISLLAANTNALGDTNDAGNIINDYGGGGFEYDITSGSPAPNGTIVGSGALIAGARSSYMHPLSWRGPTMTTGTTIYKLNNGDFVAVNSTSVPSFSEIKAGVVTINTMGAWGAITDVTTQTMYYNYSGYTPSFHMSRIATDTSSLLNLKIFNKYSTSIDTGLASTGASYDKVAKASNTSLFGWTAYDGATGTLYGDFYTTAVTYANSVAATAAHIGSYFYNANIPPGGDSQFVGGGIQMLNAVAVQTPNYFGFYQYPSNGGSNLLPWRVADVFLLHGTLYGFNTEYIFAIPLSNGSSGTIPTGQAPVAVAYGIGLEYLCVSPTKAYFLSNYDNSVYYFDGGRSLIKFFEANQKSPFTAGAYSVRDNALYLLSVASVITIRDEQTQGGIVGQVAGINSEGLQITENLLPTGWVAGTSYIKSTAIGLFYITGNNISTRSYAQNSPIGGASTLIPMDYRTAHHGPGEWQTMQVGRVVGQVYCSQKATASIRVYFYYIGVDGVSGSSYVDFTTVTQNADGYWRFSWTPPVSNVIAGSVRVVHTSSEQKIVLMELVMYYKESAEIIPLSQAAV